MTGLQLTALLPLLILSAGSVLVLLAGAIRPGWYHYQTAAAAALAAGALTLLLPVDSAVSGLCFTGFSRLMTLVFCGTGTMLLLTCSSYNRRRGVPGEEIPAVMLFALTGMVATVSATTLLMLFLGLEAGTFAFYILVASEPGSEHGGEAGLKYLLNGTLAAAILGLGIGLIYCDSGTLDLAALAGTRPGTISPLRMTAISLMLLGVAFKLSLVPLHLWTADVYQGAPAPVTALLSTASKGTAVAALVLLIPLFESWRGTGDLLRWLAILTMLAGNLAAMAQNSLKRLLAWSSVGQMGYVALAFAAASPRSAVFYLMAYCCAGLASFGAVAAVSGQEEADQLDGWRGLGYRSPLAGLALSTAMLSLAGIPPTAGFMAKFAVLSAALRAGELALALTGIAAAALAAYAYLRVIVTLYMKTPGDQPTGLAVEIMSVPETLLLLLAAGSIFLLGLIPSPLLDLLGRIIPVQ